MTLRHFGIASVAALISASTAAQSETWDQSVKRLCRSLQQEDCWVKSGAALCDKEQIACRPIEDHAPAIAVRKVGPRWLVKTAQGTGWVSGRMIILNGGKIPGQAYGQAYGR
jgi:hypothetical protein